MPIPNATKILAVKLTINATAQMNVAGLQPTSALWKSIMKEKKDARVGFEFAPLVLVRLSLIDTMI